MDLAVNILCRNPNDDRIIPRFGRYLQESLGWPLTARPIDSADLFYLSGYFEYILLRPWPPDRPVMAYFTHREENPPGNKKARLFDSLGAAVDLRIVTAGQYGQHLAQFGPTVQIRPPVERDRFYPVKRQGKRRAITAGFSGYVYRNGRKGEDLAQKLVRLVSGIQWQASGRGWPVQTRNYTWGQMPAFYQSLDILVITADVEGVPMPALEALACGCSIVAPLGVGLLDELPDTPGIHRYKRRDIGDLARAFRQAVQARPAVNVEALRAITEPYTLDAWIDGHWQAVRELMQKDRPMLNGIIQDSDGQIIERVKAAFPEVTAIMVWTGKKIPKIKRQIAAYQGAVLAYYASQQNRPGARFLEIGTALGYSACLMATAAPSAKIITLNPKNGEYQKAVKNLAIRSNVKVIQQTSQDCLEAAYKEQPDFDLVFVDGDHSYNMVLHDARFFNFLRPGGVILFHDYSPDGSERPCQGSFEALNHLQETQRPADIKVIGSGQVGMLGWIKREGETWPA